LMNETPEPFELLVVDNMLQDISGMDLIYKTDEIPIQRRPKSILLTPLSDKDTDYSFVRISRVTKPVFVSVFFDTIMDLLFDRSDFPKGVLPLSNDIRNLASRLARQIHVLLVEDNRVNQVVAQNLLACAGVTCDIANNGREACEAVRSGQYDLVLMDCQMPEMDGYEATDLIRNWERECGAKRLPIIALTANATTEDIHKCFNAGMDAYCSKPIHAADLFKEIERVLNENTI